MRTKEVQKNIEETVTAIQEDILKLEKIYPDGKDEFNRISNNVGNIEMYAYDALGIVTKEEEVEEKEKRKEQDTDNEEQPIEDKNPYQFGADHELIIRMEQIFTSLKPKEIRGFLEDMFESWLPDCLESSKSIQDKYSFIRANISFLEHVYGKYNFKSIFN